MTENQFLAAIFFVGGLFILAVFRGLVLRAIRIYRHGSKAEAVVIKSRSSWVEGRGYRTRISFSDESNVQAYAKVDTPSRLSQGEQIPIVYDRANPKRARTEEGLQKMRLDRGLWRLPDTWALLTVAAVFFILGLLFLAGVWQIDYQPGLTR